MKNALLLAAISASLFFGPSANAQIPGVGKIKRALPKVTVGLKLGANFQELSGDGDFKKSYAGGVVGGAFVGVTKNNWGVQGEVLIKSVTYNYQSIAGVGTPDAIKGVYLDVPVLLEYRIIPRLWAQLGPQYSELISAKESGTDVKKEFNASDFSGVLGLEAHLPLHLTLSARYVLGLLNVNNTSESGVAGSWNNRAIQLAVGFRFL